MTGDATLAVCWPAFGPYHAARLDALAAAHPGRVVGLETDPDDDTYAWDFTPRPIGWEHVRGGGPGTVAARLNGIRPDVLFVNGWGFRSSRAALRWALRTGTSAVLFSDSRGDDAGRGGLRLAVADQMKRRVVRLFDAAVVAGAPHRRFLERLSLPADRLFEGLDVVDNAHFAAAIPLRETLRTARPAGGADDSPRFLFVGRFVPKKNPAGLVAAFAAYRRTPTGRDAGGVLTLVGAGPEEAAVRAAAAGVPGVRIEPFRQSPDLPAVFAAADALVLPSVRSEQWGLVVNEALAAGLPALVANGCGCVEDLIEPADPSASWEPGTPGNGFTFDPHAPGALTAALERFAALPPDRRAAMGRRSEAIIARWTPARFAAAARAAAEIALARPRRKRVVDRLLLAALDARG